MATKAAFRVVAGGIAVLGVAAACYSMAMTASGGNWPDTWPKELEPLRKQARSIQFASGTQEDIYEITFTDRKQFEELWPFILKVKTPGAPLRLSSPRPRQTGDLFVTDQPCVRIYAPPKSGGITVEGKTINPGPPWPKYLESETGALPEYVVLETPDGEPRWVAEKLPARGEKPKGFYIRARMEIELVVDGSIIDLNRIPLPADTPIIDRRFPK